MTELLLDRHLLASNATTWDTAWGTYGWTPALEGARASRLEERVPWGTRSARLERPPRLSGPASAVLDPANRDRLGRALLPMDDGRLGFSLWGAVGDERVGSEWRLATHTLLLTEDDLRALAGHPEGLLSDPAAPGGVAPWFRELVEHHDLSRPAPLAPVRVVRTPALAERLAADRLAEIERLLATVLAARDGDRRALAAELADAYEALAAAVRGRAVRHVAVRVDGRGDDGAPDPGQALLRLAWLSLPLEDRARVHWVSEQRRAERPPGHLLGLPADEWGRYVPEGAWVLGDSEPVDVPSPGRLHWADALLAAGGPDEFRRLDARAALRGWRIVTADDLRRVGEHARWRTGWTRNGPSLEAVAELVEREGGRPSGPRAVAVGDALGRAVAAGTEPGDAVGVLDGLQADYVDAAVQGAVRALREAGEPGRGGLLRAAATERLGGGAGPLLRGLRRMVDRESASLRALLSLEGGPVALVRAAFAGSAAGDPVARELVRLGAAAGRWDPEEGARLATALPVEGSVDAGVREAVADLLVALVREGASPGEVEAVADPLLDRLEPGVVEELAAAVTGPGGADFIDRPAAEALRRAAVLRAADGGGRELDDAVAALITLGGRTAPPAVEPEPWGALLDRAPGVWLSRQGVLDALVGVLGAGARPLDDPEVPSSVRSLASMLARRVLERAGAGSLDRGRATALLRLMWLEGDGSTARWLVGIRPDAAPALLAQLLVAPAPLGLVPTLRSAFVQAIDTGADLRGLESVAEELRAWAPALYERAGLGGSAGRILPLAAAAPRAGRA